MIISKPQLPLRQVTPNQLHKKCDRPERVFTATRLNQRWMTDVPPTASLRREVPPTEHWTDEGKLYLCAIKDVLNRPQADRGKDL